MISYVDCDVDCDMDSYMPGGGGMLTTDIEASRWSKLLCSRFCFTKKIPTKVLQFFLTLINATKIQPAYITKWCAQNGFGHTIALVKFLRPSFNEYIIDKEYDNVWTLYTVWKVEKQQCLILKWRTMKHRLAKLKNTCTNNLATFISWREHGSLVWGNLWTSSCWPLSLSNGWDW